MVINYPPVSDRQFSLIFLKMLSLLSSAKDITEAEAEVLSYFMVLPAKYKYFRFAPQARKLVISLFKEDNKDMSPANLNNKIHSLVNKGYIIRQEDNMLVILPSLLKAVDAFKQTGKLDINLNFTREDTTQ
jgi:hypothetical protein